MKSAHECTMSYGRGASRSRLYFQSSSLDIDLLESLKSSHRTKKPLLNFHLVVIFANLLGSNRLFLWGFCSTLRYFKTPRGQVGRSPEENVIWAVYLTQRPKKCAEWHNIIQQDTLGLEKQIFVDFGVFLFFSPSYSPNKWTEIREVFLTKISNKGRDVENK